VAKNHFVIRAANFCQLMPLLAYNCTDVCDVFHRNEKVQKSPKHDIWTYWSVRGKKSLRDSRSELLSISANIGTGGCDVLDQNEKV
jgi:hypothetical protein